MEYESLSTRRVLSGATLIIIGGLALSGESSPSNSRHEVQASVVIGPTPIAEAGVTDRDNFLLHGLQRQRASRSRSALPKLATAPTPKPTDINLPDITDDPDFVRLRYCESTDTPNINSGNGFYGAYQFDRQTWIEYGGLRFAKRADLASLKEQTIIAAKLRAARGYQPWPDCSRKLGLVFHR